MPAFAAVELSYFYTESMTNPQRAREVFAQMRDSGADAVIFNVYEQDLIRWPRDLPRIATLASEAGLKRYISPGRHAGVFSGLAMAPSLFAFVNPDTLVQLDEERSRAATEAESPVAAYFRRVCCINHPKVRRYLHDQLQQMLDLMRPDGVLFDEPKGLSLVCVCEHCGAARRSGESPEEANKRRQTQFLGELCDRVKQSGASRKTMVVTGWQEESMLERFAGLAALDVLGTEAYWVPRRKDMAWLRDWCPKAIARLKGLGKQTQVWANNWGLTREQQAHLPEAYRIMASSGADQLCSFWWWRSSDDPEAVMDITMRSVSEIRRSQPRCN